jgi:hypothetical protein
MEVPRYNLNKCSLLVHRDLGTQVVLLMELELRVEQLMEERVAEVQVLQVREL